MQYRQLGRTDLKVSAIGLGTMTWGKQNSQQDGFEQMDYALECGINFFDTAEMYAIPPTAQTFGTTETIIGHWFAARRNREKVILATKMTGPGSSWIRDGDIINTKNIHLALNDSLRRLQTDYVDLYQFHWPNRGSYHFGRTWNYAPKFAAQQQRDNFLECLHALHSLVNDGKIRHFGLSNETAWGLCQWLNLADQHQLPRAVSIQNEFSLLCRHFEPDMSEIAMNEGCGLLAWSPLTRGMISGKYLEGARPAGSRLSIETRIEHRVYPQTDEAIVQYIGLAQLHQLDVCQMAIAFVLGKPFVTSVLVGATNMTQLKTDIAAQSINLSPAVLQGIQEIHRRYPAPF